MTAFPPPPSRLNGVGYNNTPSTDDASIIIGASFEDMGGKGFLPFNALQSPSGLETMDQIQKSYTDERGMTQLHTYEYDEYDGWLDIEDNYNPCGDTVGLELGMSAWFIAYSEAKPITTAGSVKKGTKTHTFTESSSLVSSAFPVSFCPNSENVSWGIESYDQIQTFYTDERGLTQLHTYEYDEYDGWLDIEDNYRVLDSDEALVGSGIGFWLILMGDFESASFTEVGPLTE